MRAAPKPATKGSPRCGEYWRRIRRYWTGCGRRRERGRHPTAPPGRPNDREAVLIGHLALLHFDRQPEPGVSARSSLPDTVPSASCTTSSEGRIPRWRSRGCPFVQGANGRRRAGLPASEAGCCHSQSDVPADWATSPTVSGRLTKWYTYQ